MMETILMVVASAPAGVGGFAVGRAWLGRRRGRHEVGVPAVRVCAVQGRPVRHREMAAHAA